MEIKGDIYKCKLCDTLFHLNKYKGIANQIDVICFDGDEARPMHHCDDKGTIGILEFSGIAIELDDAPDWWYFTFGANHIAPITKESLENYYIKQFGTYSTARLEMVRLFKDNWSVQYREDEFLPQIKEYNLTELIL